MASPGPSRARSGAAAQPFVKLPASIDVEKLALGRRTEIFSMERAMKASRDSGAQRAFQSLPRHLRRRAASHHIRRLPARLRAKAKLEIMHEQAKVLKKKGFRQLPAKKKRKLLRFSRLEILHGRQKTKAWLETHIWHAKRMKMVDVWGYRLAHTPTEKSFRPSYRAAVHGVIASDTSYYQTIELKGIFESLAAVLASVTDAAAVPASATRFAGGIRECQTTLYRHREYPLGAIGPVSVLWDVPAEHSAQDMWDRRPSLRQLLIRFHPAMLDAVSKALGSAIRRFQEDVYMAAKGGALHDDPWRPTEEVAQIKASIGLWHRRLCSFEVVGPMATDAIKSCLRPISGTSADKMKTWDNLPPPSAVPEGTVVTLDVYDPRLHFPPSLAKSSQSHGKAAAVHPHSTLAAESRFWDADVRKKLVAPKYSKVQLDERRAKLLLPGTPLSAQAQDDRIPIILIQRTIASPASSSSAAPSSSDPCAPISGWTLLLPAGWGLPFFHSLAHADTRIGGLRERAQQSFEAGCAHFPQDWPGTPAYAVEAAGKEKGARSQWERRPPAKRVNFGKLGTESPFSQDFAKVVENGRRWTRSPQIVKSEAGGTSTQEDDINAIGDMQVDQAPSDAATAQIPKPAIRTRKGRADLSGSKPWLLSGPLARKVFDMGRESGTQQLPSPEVDHHVLCERILAEAIAHARDKRSLPSLATSVPAAAPAGRLPPLASSALVRVRMTPYGRGAPKDNAMIYMMAREQAQEVRDELRRSERSSERGRVGSSKKGKAAEGPAELEAGTDEERDLEDEESDTTESEQGSKAFRQPPVDNVVGYVTTGNVSLARGRGSGIGAVSLLSLVWLAAQESHSSFRKGESRLLVLFRNPNSRVCRAATLEILQ